MFTHVFFYILTIFFDLTHQLISRFQFGINIFERFQLNTKMVYLFILMWNSYFIGFIDVIFWLNCCVWQNSTFLDIQKNMYTRSTARKNESWKDLLYSDPEGFIVQTVKFANGTTGRGLFVKKQFEAQEFLLSY